MYIQSQFREPRENVLQDLIRQHPLATFVVHTDELIINHFPLVFESTGKHGVLTGHIPAANSLCDALKDGCEAVAIFHGPEGYVSPNWYPSKHEHGKAVPTWNYAVVHASGVANAVNDSDWLLAHLTKLTNQQEHEQPLPWQVTDAPADFTEKMIGAIVGVQMPIDSIVGKWKISQNRPHTDKLGVAAGLRNRGSSDDIELEAMMRAALEQTSAE